MAKLFPQYGGFRVVRCYSHEYAEQMCARELWDPEFDSVSGELLGYRIAGGARAKVDTDLRTRRTDTGISPCEMQLNVEHSQTYGLRESARLERLKAGLDAEDDAERVQAKVRVYRDVTPERGSILKAWPR